MAWPRFLKRLFGAVEPVAAAPATEPVVEPVDDELEDDEPEDDDDEDEDDEEEQDEADGEDGDDDDDAPIGARARHPELEAALRAAPLDPAPHLVYADWLQQQGDPRGELIAVQRTLATTLDPEQRRELRSREQDLIASDREELEGPLPAAYVRFRLGFVRHAHVEDELPKGAKLARLLDHVAYLLLESLCVNDDDVDDVRAVLAELGRDHVVISTEDTYLPTSESIAAVTGHGTVETHAGQRWVKIFVEDDFGMGNGSHSFLTRTALASGSWSYGCDASLCEDGLADDPVRTETFPCAVTDHEIECELRFGIENDGGELEMYFHGVAPLPAGDGSFEIRLARCDALTGPPFEASPAEVRLGTVGPTLVEGNDSHGGVIPGHGVIQRIDQLVTPTGVRSLPGFAPPEPGYLNAAAGGADGTLVAVSSPAWSKTRDASIKSWLSLMVLPEGKPAHRALKDYVAQLVPLSEHRVAVVTTSTIHVLDARTGADRWSVALEPIQNVRERTWELALIEHEGRLHMLRDDHVTSYALDSGAPAPAWPLPSLVTTLNNYGVGVAAFHPQPERVAWMFCGSSSHCGMDPMAIVGWRDRDGTGGEVAIAEEGWARSEDAFGKVAVLPDGRIVAVGTSVWLVEPPSRTPVRIGDAGGYNQPLQLTQMPSGGWRLWNPGAGGWYLELT